MDAVYLICLEVSEHILRKAHRLSYRFACVKIVTSSKYSSRFESLCNIEIIEVSQEFHSIFHNLESTKISRHLDYVGRGDLAEKRSFVIQNAFDCQFEAILIVDDDIWPIPEAHRQLFLNSDFDVGGQPPISQPDLSTIERIDRSKKAFHDNINGNYLYLRLNKIYPFFPRIYNEDWIFLKFIECSTKSVIFNKKHEIYQSRKSIRNSDRAYYEEFGEFVIDILSAEHQRGKDVSLDLVNQLYIDRRSYLTELGKSVADVESEQSVEAALRALDAFDPSFALDYIEVVRAEMGRWRYA